MDAHTNMCGVKGPDTRDQALLTNKQTTIAQKAALSTRNQNPNPRRVNLLD
jgi:hypothetical protein